MQRNTERTGLRGWFDPQELGVMAQKVRRREAGRVKEDWSGTPLARVVERLVRDHRRWLHVDLPTLESLLDQIGETHGGGGLECVSGLRRAFSRLRLELQTHASGEESVLFPAIAGLERAAATGAPPTRLACGSSRHPIAMMRRDLEAQEALLAHIRDLVQECTSHDGADESLNGCFREFEADLRAHIRLEDNILFPRTIQLEQAVWKRHLLIPRVSRFRGSMLNKRKAL